MQLLGLRVYAPTLDRTVKSPKHCSFSAGFTSIRKQLTMGRQGEGPLALKTHQNRLNQRGTYLPQISLFGLYNVALTLWDHEWASHVRTSHACHYKDALNV